MSSRRRNKFLFDPCVFCGTRIARHPRYKVHDYQSGMLFGKKNCHYELKFPNKAMFGCHLCYVRLQPPTTVLTSHDLSGVSLINY